MLLMSTALIKNITSVQKARPVLKWAGGKRQLLEEIEKRLPEKFGTYYEPFFGGGAVYFHFGFQNAIVGDINEELINVYKIIQNNVDDLILYLQKHHYNREYFYKIRSLNISELSFVERAARMIYLNKCCYNGLYRVNSRGIFNVPFGNHKNPLICDAANLRLVNNKIQKTKFFCDQYYNIIRTSQSGDFVYFDPPYEPVSASSNFVSYAKSGFDSNDQRKLSDLFKDLSNRGVFCMLSNSDVPLIRTLYSEFNIHSVTATRQLNSVAKKRGKVSEVIVTNY